MRFSDFYAGGGGWSLGLALSGMRQVMSAEIWPVANRTREWNFGTSETEIDIRKMDPASVPDCDLIVGSPPCTQFSYANKGGNGNLQDGMQDVRSFLRVIREKNPRYWVMENVPRLADILRSELREGGALAEFSDLFTSIDVFDMSDWGVPQRRRRCIAGRYPREALLALRGRRAPTLADIVEGCASGVDPVWGHLCTNVTDNDPGASLTWEEERINREKKQNHPIYNDMAFPDAPDATARTVTATCTKVSRESIVVPDGNGGYRLLTAREMAAVQSFPLNYQFPAKSQTDRVKMAGNAIPPLFTYLVGLAVKGEAIPGTLPSFTPVGGDVSFAAQARTRGNSKKADRAFRAAVSKLRFKSGMSFEVNNINGRWKMVFNLGGQGRVETLSPADISGIVGSLSDDILKAMPEINATEVQDAWANSMRAEYHPFMIIDMIEDLIPAVELDWGAADKLLERAYAIAGSDVPNKASHNQEMIAIGLVLADAFNRKIG